MASDLEDIKHSQTTILGKLETLCRDVGEIKTEVKAQGAAIHATALWRAGTEERLREGSKKLIALAQDRKDCEAKHEAHTKEVASTIEAQVAQMVANVEAQTMKKSDLLLLLLKIVLAGAAGGTVVAGASKLLGA